MLQHCFFSNHLTSWVLVHILLRFPNILLLYTVIAPFFHLHVPSLLRVLSLSLYVFTVGCTFLHVDSAHTSSCPLFVSRNWTSDYSGIRRSERRSRDQEYRHTSREADSWERERYGTTSPAHHRSSEDYWEYHSRRDGERSYSDRYARHKHFWSDLWYNDSWRIIV